MRPGSALPVLGAAALALLLAATFTPLVPALARRLASPARLEPADAIVALGADVSPDGTLSSASLRRTVHALRLYRRGLAPLVVFTGVPARRRAPAEAAARAALAGELGLAGPMVLTLETRSTAEEAAKTRDLLGPRGVRRVLLVTESLHLVRATGVFERVGFTVLPAPPDCELGGESPEDRLGIARELSREILARALYRLTAQASRPP